IFSTPQNGTWKDSNGNIKGGTTDTLGRTFYTTQQTSDANGNPVQIQYTVLDSNGNPQTYTVNWKIINISTNFQNGSNGYGPVKEMTPGPTYFGCCPWNVIQSIVLPNGLSYQFKYDDGGYGQIVEIDLPSGAVITYTYANLQNNRKTKRYVASRTETVNGVSSTWNFLIAPVYSQNAELDQYTSTVTYPAVGSPSVANQSVFVSSSGSTTDAQIYAGAAQGSPLREYKMSYGIDLDPLADDLCFDDTLFGPQDPQAVGTRLTSITTILENGLQSKKEFDYETLNYVYHPNHCTYKSSSGDSTTAKTYTTSRGNVTEIREYDWGQGAPGPLIRRTDKTYLHNANSNYLTLNIVDKVLQETIYDGSSNQVGQTQYEFDNYVSGV